MDQKIMYLVIPNQWGMNTTQAMTTVDVANCCLKEVAKHTGDPHQYIVSM